MRLTTLDIKRIKRLRYHDGLTIEQTAQAIGCGITTIKQYAPGHIGKVPNDKLRAAFEKSGQTAADVARRMGWMCRLGNGGTCADVTRVKRTLGLLPEVNGKGHRSTRRLIDAETAGLMAEAIGVMAWEVMPDEQDDDERAAA